jgi:hypothetical protein
MQTPTIKDQKRAKAQAKANAKELAEFNKYKNMVKSGKSLHQQVLRFEETIANGTFANCLGIEFYEWFGNDDLQQNELIFDMLEWSEDRRIFVREIVASGDDCLLDRGSNNI